MRTTWQPTFGWLLLEPTRLPDQTEAGIVLPESYTVKATSGICRKAGFKEDERLIGMELFFPRHEEYQIVDSDSGELFYVVPASKVILMREPPEQPAFVTVGFQGTQSQRPLERSMP